MYIAGAEVGGEGWLSGKGGYQCYSLGTNIKGSYPSQRCENSKWKNGIDGIGPMIPTRIAALHER